MPQSHWPLNIAKASSVLLSKDGKASELALKSPIETMSDDFGVPILGTQNVFDDI